MFIWIGAASLLVLVVSVIKLHKVIGLKLLATYYEAEVHFLCNERQVVIFTSRTYRIAIRRSIEHEQRIREAKSRSRCASHIEWLLDNLQTQINHTRKLQARKRKERK